MDTQDLGGAPTITMDRERVVHAAQETVESHSCGTCATGRVCDTIFFAAAVVELNHDLRLTAEASTTDEGIQRAHESGRVEAVAQALAVLGRTEGQYRAEADGDTSHLSFALAEALRSTALVIRSEVRNPTSRTALEIMARAEEAFELAEYVRDVSTRYQDQTDVAEALSSVAGDIEKGTEGVNRLQRATDISTPVEELAALARDNDADVRWWVAQNPSTSVETLSSAVMTERHPQVLIALLQNPALPTDRVRLFIEFSHHDVAAAARRRLGDPSAR
ncbi:hypothetical protein [Demequina mangrovi]|uniref:Leucine rich repeat variant n=1 Tax=Demequina mangrovi TaxID=1043493 RepID=A0A1H6TVW4_9MICO|nr:hypothetical protein [Demequina mangrovi]SEI83356.1 hypothetical protein SAMN05421637_0135 [Demequina mangrovi]